MQDSLSTRLSKIYAVTQKLYAAATRGRFTNLVRNTDEGPPMTALALAMAARVSDSAFGQAWRKTGEALDIAIPLVLAAALVAGAASVLFGFVQ
jgi:hypothetical protein